MRRVLHGHDKPYAIFETLGGWPESFPFESHEKTILGLIDKATEGDRDSGCHFDILSLEFWLDVRGDFKHADPRRFPDDLDPVVDRLRQLDTSLGLWADSGGLPEWTIGSNPLIQNAYTEGPGKGGICRADKTVNHLYTDGFLYQIHHNGVKLLKFDNFGWPDFFRDPICNNPKHDHLPGIYSTEAIENGVIGVYKALRQEDVFIMLYWGYRSPWWLLYADTLFDSGTRIEGSSFAAFPAPYARESTIRRMDEARWLLKDIPPLGWDTLGTWLADWEWNSRIGKVRWQDSVAMDISRGHLLAQIWTDPGWLSPPERSEMADFIHLLKGAGHSFRNCRFVFGNPWKDEAYGYLCSDGQRAFVAINNGTWNDNIFRLEFNSNWGLPAGKTWDVYRWYPEPAHLEATNHKPFRQTVSLALRPFTVALLEIVPTGQEPTLKRSFFQQEIPQKLAGASHDVPLLVSDQGITSGEQPTRNFLLRGEAPPAAHGGLLTVTVELRDVDQPHWIKEQGKTFSIEGKLNNAAITPEAALSEGYPSPWQSWRIELPAVSAPQALELSLKSTVPKGIALIFRAHFIPNDPAPTGK